MRSIKYEYQSDFARKYFGQGQVEGRAAIILRQLNLRFGPLPEEVRSRIGAASIEELDGIGERLLTAHDLREALEAH